jgi:hypothetical protein
MIKDFNLLYNRNSLSLKGRNVKLFNLTKLMQDYVENPS